MFGSGQLSLFRRVTVRGELASQRGPVGLNDSKLLQYGADFGIRARL